MRRVDLYLTTYPTLYIFPDVKRPHRIPLRAARAKAKLTQEQLEAASGVPQEVISRLENGVTVNPSFDTVLKLAEALDMDPRQLVFGPEGVTA